MRHCTEVRHVILTLAPLNRRTKSGESEDRKMCAVVQHHLGKGDGARPRCIPPARRRGSGVP
jgi:hypothetical protein